MNAQNEKQDVQSLKLVTNEDGWKCVEVNGKQSVVPDGWVKDKLGSLFDVSMGKTILSKDLSKSGSDGLIPVFSATEERKVFGYISKNALSTSDLLDYGDIVIGARGSLGHPKLMDGASTSTQTTIQCKSLHKSCSEFVVISGRLHRDWFSVTGSGVPMLTAATVKNIEIVLPPHPEQQRIASVLTSQESRIEDLRAWAQTERDRLTWLTDELLSGRVRVVERIGEREVVVEQNADGQVVEGLGAYDLVDHKHQKAPWASTTVREIGKSTSGATPPTSDKQYWGGDLIWVTPKDMDDLDGPYIKTSEKKLTQAGYDFMERKKVSAGSVIFSTRGSIGKVAAAKKEMRISQSCESFSFDDSSPEFMVYLFRWKMAEIKEKGAGTTFMSITKKDIEDIEVRIPEKHEQQRIAAVLSAQERQIADIEQLIEIEQQRLSWLTDELLSGRVRVVENT